MPESEKLPPDPNSRSQRKRDVERVRKLASTLIDLPQAQLGKMSLPETLVDLIRFSHTLKAHGAAKRHLQFIVRNMLSMDLEQIQGELTKLTFAKTIKTAQFHAAEEWRERLIAEGDNALQHFIKSHPEADAQQLRQLTRQAQLDKKKEINTGAEKQLFKLLMTLLTPETK